MPHIFDIVQLLNINLRAKKVFIYETHPQNNKKKQCNSQATLIVFSLLKNALRNIRQ